MKKFLLLSLNLALALLCNAQNKSLYEEQLFIRGEDTLPCRILTPINYSPAKKYPVLVFLHGMGERGSDNEKQLTWGADLFLDSLNRVRFPAIIIFPQCPLNSYWSPMKYVNNTNDSLGQWRMGTDTMTTMPMQLILSFIDTLVLKGTADKNRIYIGGLSMGGFGTFDVLHRRPDLFAAAFPICGAGDPTLVQRYRKKLPIWVFHGATDPVVSVSNSRIMVAALEKVKANVKYTEYPGVGHDSWKNAFAEPDLLPWLFGQKIK
jgi:predicted peptidase